MKGNSKGELGTIKAKIMVTLKKLTLLLRHNNYPKKLKNFALGTAIRSKLLYGLDSLQLHEPELKRLDKIHVQAIRKNGMDNQLC